MFIICLHHFTYSNLIDGSRFIHPNNFYDLAHVFFTHMGNFGNCLFAIVSAYFLVDNNTVKFSKIFSIIIKQSLITVIISFLYFLIVKKLGRGISLYAILSALFPFLFGMHWFIQSYIIYYIIHSPLNKLLSSLSKKQLFFICMLVFLLYFFISLYWRVNLPKSSVTYFIFIHCFVFYNKKFMQKYNRNATLNTFIALASFLLWIITIFLLIYVSNCTLLDLVFVSNSMIHPLLIILFISLINLFNNFVLYNIFINYIASLMISVYIIHENVYIQQYIRNVMWAKLINSYSDLQCIIIGIIISISAFVVCTIFASLFSLCDSFINKLSTFLVKKINYFIF